MNAIALYLLSVKENGISESAAAKLTRGERMLLEQRGGKYYLKASERSRFKVVLTGGAFDVLHMGHVLTLQEARKLGDVLVAIVAADATVEKRKGKKPLHEAEYRRAMVEALKPVGVAIVGGGTDWLDTFARVQPDVVAFGYDQKPIPLPEGCRSAHLKDVVSDPSVAKTSAVIRKLGL